MKHKIFLGALLIGLTGIFTACSDDNDSNPTLIQPTEFVLNTPSYAAETVDLSTTEALKLTWSQPKYTDNNAPINATYEIQVSPTNSFTVSTVEAEADEEGNLKADYAIIDKTATKCEADLSAEDLDKALVQVAKWTEDAVPAEQKAYVRINAYVLEGTNKLNPIASNTVELNVAPYYIELKDAAPIMWYMLGNDFGDGAWKNNADATGTSNFPMFLKPGATYDKKTGEGEIEYLNYFGATEFKILPSTFNWDYCFMNGGSANTAAYRNGAGDAGNISISPAGYYLVTINTANNTCTIAPQDITPTKYDQICITGDFNGWADQNMTPANKSGENHAWYYTLTVPAGETTTVKFKIPGSWDTNWGYGVNDGDINTYGKATNGGKNIGVAEGTWVVCFNDITGAFSIIAK